MGVGTDIHELERTADAIKRRGIGYLERLFTVNEIAAGKNRRDAAGFFARRFAAKEACAKALGTGITGRVNWHDIEITRDGPGAPKIALSGGALQRARRLAPKCTEIHAHVSLATARGLCVAVVVLEARPVWCDQSL
ncbi:holo-ACP synthase [Bradyrhizobium elkanii]|uniref:holo-ACP synthase n=1 Tax=Bradyrhizobium elkanii TaxID=29448 RepID=UPI00216AA091|nr:holo-ACP synthase [Bradyrhizobium elkanii]